MADDDILDVLSRAHPAIKAAMALLIQDVSDAQQAGQPHTTIDMLESLGLDEKDLLAVDHLRSHFQRIREAEGQSDGLDPFVELLFNDAIGEQMMLGQALALIIGISAGAMLYGESQRPRQIRRVARRPPAPQPGKGAAGGRRRPRKR